jgi:hypothetical protein
MPEKPQWHHIGNKNICFPKDPQAGGTWFAVDQSANTGVLLNGATEPHKPMGPYERSRGLVLLDVIGADNPEVGWQNTDLSAIEPFTLVLFSGGDLKLLRWNFMEKSEATLTSANHHIWASVTLYSPEAIRARTEWFGEFMESHENPEPDDLIHFHLTAGSHDPRNGLVMERDGKVKTQSVTQVVLSRDAATLFHRNVISKLDYTETFQIL